MQVNFPHAVYYDPEGDLTLTEIANTLIAQEKIIARVGMILEIANPGLKVEKVKIELRHLEIASLREEFLVALFLSFQEDIENEVMGLIESVTGVAVPEKYEALVTLLVIVVVLYGARYIYNRVFPRREPAHIQGNYNTVVNVTARVLTVTPEAMNRAVEQGLPPAERRNLARAVTDFLRPAKRGGDTPIAARGTPGISREAVAEFPSEIDLEAVENTNMRTFEGVAIDIRATDRDRSERGWAGKILGVDGFDRRLPMKLYPTVDTEQLAARERVTADVMVEYRRDESDEMVARIIHVIRVLGDDPA